VLPGSSSPPHTPAEPATAQSALAAFEAGDVLRGYRLLTGVTDQGQPKDIAARIAGRRALLAAYRLRPEEAAEGIAAALRRFEALGDLIESTRYRYRLAQVLARA